MGCGTGVALQYLVEECEFCAVGIDVSKALLAEGGAKTPGLLLVRASGSALPFPDESMEAVLAECSLSLMDAEGALGECWRVLKREGLLLVHDVYARNPHAQLSLQGLPVKCCLTGAVSREQWVARLEARGFAVNLWEDHSHTLKEFAARLIFQHGSLNAFWGSSEIEDRLKIQCAVSSAKPGYFLAVAKKEA
jgi:ubiquinone/menaquinone biosynthesis C-methylase UbiE